MITVILNGHKRPEYLVTQVQAILNQTESPHTIWLWLNEHQNALKSEFEIEGIQEYIVSTYNFKYHGRFALGLLARTEYVAFFDDDTVPGPRWLENCKKCYEEEPGILGGVGVVLKSGTYGDHDRVGWPSPSEEKKYADLVGHAWFMKRSDLKYLWYDDPISLDNGEDIQLSYQAQKHGKLKTYCPPHPPNDRSLWSSLAGETLGNDGKASSNASNPDWALFIEERKAIVREALKKGWKTVRDVSY